MLEERIQENAGELISLAPPDMRKPQSCFLYAFIVNRRQYAIVFGFYRFRIRRLQWQVGA